MYSCPASFLYHLCIDSFVTYKNYRTLPHVNMARYLKTSCHRMTIFAMHVNLITYYYFHKKNPKFCWTFYFLNTSEEFYCTLDTFEDSGERLPWWSNRTADDSVFEIRGFRLSEPTKYSDGQPQLAKQLSVGQPVNISGTVQLTKMADHLLERVWCKHYRKVWLVLLKQQIICENSFKV